MARILIIDDDPDVLRTLELFLTNQGHVVQPQENPLKFLSDICIFKPDLVILDIMMPIMTGGTVYQGIRHEIGPHLPIIVSSASRVSLRGEDPLLLHVPKTSELQKLSDAIEQLLHPCSAVESLTVSLFPAVSILLPGEGSLTPFSLIPPGAQNRTVFELPKQGNSDKVGNDGRVGPIQPRNGSQSVLFRRQPA